MLSHVYMTLAMSLFQKDGQKAAEEHYLLAYTAALHGAQDDVTQDVQNNALSLYLGEIGLRTQQEILFDLSTKHPDKFKALKEGYQSCCKVLSLSPLSHLDNIDKPKQPLIFSGSSLSPSSSLALSSASVLASRREEAAGSSHSSLSLDEVTETEASLAPGVTEFPAEFPVHEFPMVNAFPVLEGLDSEEEPVMQSAIAASFNPAGM